tara:strand:+ start:807 stop:1733 length:927 start_codon:yes stop_codon:yes gene_type:complete
MRNEPLVTVLMPIYNGEKYLEESIRSILNQTFQDFEFLLIDDFSTDDSLKIAKSFSSKKIKLICNSQNYGQSVSMNNGIKLAKGKFIARIDQDDLSDQARLEKQLKYFTENKCSILGSWAYTIDENSKVIGYIKHPIKNQSIRNALGIDCALSHSSIMMRKDDIISIGSYSKKYKIAMDWDLWVRASKKGFIINNIPEYLCYSRVHNLQATNKKSSGAYNFINEKIFILKNSKDLIDNKKNYNAYLGWKFYYEAIFLFRNMNNKNFYRFFSKKTIRGLFEFIKLIIFHKIINKPSLLYIAAVQYNKKI